MNPDIFLSWSGQRGRKLAELLHQFIPDVIQSARPWISSTDIDKGRRWNNEIAKALETAKAGIICLTPESLHSEWILFEAGALAKAVESSRVCPYLLGLEMKDLSSPLADLQATLANKADTLKLMESLNQIISEPLKPERLKRVFDQFWPALEAEIAKLANETVEPKAKARSDSAVLEEILLRVRSVEHKVSSPENASGGWPAVLSHGDFANYIAAPSQNDQELVRMLESLTDQRGALVKLLHESDSEPFKAKIKEQINGFEIAINSLVQQNPKAGLWKGIRELLRAKSLRDAPDPAA